MDEPPLGPTPCKCPPVPGQDHSGHKGAEGILEEKVCMLEFGGGHKDMNRGPSPLPGGPEPEELWIEEGFWDLGGEGKQDPQKE